MIRITNHRVAGLLHELEELQIIKVLQENVAPAETKLSDKYRGVFSKEDADSFENHTQNMRKEWDNT